MICSHAHEMTAPRQIINSCRPERAMLLQNMYHCHSRKFQQQQGLAQASPRLCDGTVSSGISTAAGEVCWLMRLFMNQH